MPVWSRPSAWGLVALSVGCNAILGIDDRPAKPADATAGAGGAGSGLAGGAAGSGAAGTGAPCITASDCAPMSCMAASCRADRCAYAPTPGPLPLDDVIGDCKIPGCDERGGSVTLDDRNDLPSEPAPSCLIWSCDAGRLSTLVAPDCTDCCGAASQLDCAGGTCVGCATPGDCGAGGPCFSFGCTASECVLSEVADGTRCSPTSCTQVGPALALSTTASCEGIVCQPTVTTCGNYTCDAFSGLCYDQCDSAASRNMCQPGNACTGGTCVDCTTCAESLSGSTTSCPESAAASTALQVCVCDNDVCLGPCASYCSSGAPPPADCASCIQSLSACAQEYAECLSDVDPTP